MNSESANELRKRGAHMNSESTVQKILCTRVPAGVTIVLHIFMVNPHTGIGGNNSHTGFVCSPEICSNYCDNRNAWYNKCDSEFLLKIMIKQKEAS